MRVQSLHAHGEMVLARAHSHQHRDNHISLFRSSPSTLCSRCQRRNLIFRLRIVSYFKEIHTHMCAHAYICIDEYVYVKHSIYIFSIGIEEFLTKICKVKRHFLTKSSTFKIFLSLPFMVLNHLCK